ncbi:MAG: hypothetical protein DIZ80_11170 [endosymbiont of Galathealinum brachiosum]|uniref:Uncharacterized protein n=1 Tax=endosymbiont of Galathealinum brachiosum TaxID=2200906 RepID=A0A370DD46_9GAMM|nr:MAG: hypothetical protein DIZ80_11170 [endosymbiont of Galathealinum brachiosum]
MPYILIAFIITWLSIFISLIEFGFNVEFWTLIVSASIGALLSSLLVLLGETIIEDIVKLILIIVMPAILMNSNPKLGFIFITALISCITGVTINQLNKYLSYKSNRSN